MTATVRRVRGAVTVGIVTVVGVVAIALGIVVTSGLGFADAVGQPLDVPAVSVAPSPTPRVEPSPTPEPSASPTPEEDEPEVVTGPPPVIVELDDHGGLRNDDSPDDNSGRGNSNG